MTGTFGVRPARAPADVASLAAILVDCVEGGASVGFMSPFDTGRAEDFWSQVLRSAEAGERTVLVAEDTADGRLVGTVQLVLCVPENQPHRAEISKMLVHRAARRRGVGELLMRAAEATARQARRTLLVLDTASADAERLYERLGWQRVGVIPNYALWPDGGFVQTTLYYKELERHVAERPEARKRRAEAANASSPGFEAPG